MTREEVKFFATGMQVIFAMEGAKKAERYYLGLFGEGVEAKGKTTSADDLDQTIADVRRDVGNLMKRSGCPQVLIEHMEQAAVEGFWGRLTMLCDPTARRGHA